MKSVLSPRIWKLLNYFTDSIQRRRLSFVLLLISLISHGVCVFWYSSGDLEVRFGDEFIALVVLSAALDVAVFIVRRVAYVRVFYIARSLVILAALSLVSMPPVAFLALLAGPALIEPVLYDNERIGMPISAAFFALVLLLVILRTSTDNYEAMYRLLVLMLIAGLPAGLGWLTVFYRERIVQLTGRKKTLESTVDSLSKANRDFQAYAGAVRTESAAEERNRITRELHDTVGYALTNVIVMMDAAKSTAQKDSGALDEILDSVRDQSENALNDTRQILYRLRSIDHSEPKGIDAIFKLTRAFEEAMGIGVELSVGNLPTSYGLRIDPVLYRFVQEGLTNAFRHGNATLVRISMWQAAREIRISVLDNGRGASSETEIIDGIGMAGMRERFAELGGSIRAQNVKDGFKISGTIPYGFGEAIG